MEDQSKLIRPIQIFFKSIWLTELAFIQGGYTPKNVVSPQPCHRYAVHLIHSVICVVQNTVDMFGPNNNPLPLVYHENNTALLRLQGEQNGFPATLHVFVTF
jgi:hypothetical protein